MWSFLLSSPVPHNVFLIGSISPNFVGKAKTLRHTAFGKKFAIQFHFLNRSKHCSLKLLHLPIFCQIYALIKASFTIYWLKTTQYSKMLMKPNPSFLAVNFINIFRALFCRYPFANKIQIKNDLGKSCAKPFVQKMRA